MKTLYDTDDLRVRDIRPVLPPAVLLEELPLTAAAAATVARTRAAIGDIIHGRDDRLLVVVGPCSIHDVTAARDYAALLRPVAERMTDELVIVMRTYFEKPRTSVGWKGLINDPRLDGTYAINQGLRLARALVLDLASSGIAPGCEFLDTITPQYLSDAVGWGAIGARTTESQVHRELASGLSLPVGFKNGTAGNVQIAVDAVLAARHPHYFLSVTKQGLSAIVGTCGNEDCHVILRGGQGATNYHAEAVMDTARALLGAGLPPRVLVDCSHGNSQKDHNRQPLVADAIAEQVCNGSSEIMGLMLESNLIAGRQDLAAGNALTYGQSITDGCLGWGETVPVLERLADAVRERRRALAPAACAG